MENSNEIKGNFSHGFLASIVGWIISSLLIALVLTIINRGTLSIMEALNDLLPGIGVIALIEAFIWIPLAIIAGNISKNKGFKSSLWFVTASFFICILVIGGCFGMLAR